ncbi:MAG: type II secretion system protein [Acidobacteria bacterium]|nr:MAG: type II secretion system protein [Acidobacteriota bacterium]
MKNPDTRQTSARGNRSQRRLGITLMEILLAVAIIGVLGTFLVPRIVPSKEAT